MSVEAFQLSLHSCIGLDVTLQSAPPVLLSTWFPGTIEFNITTTLNNVKIPIPCVTWFIVAPIFSRVLNHVLAGLQICTRSRIECRKSLLMIRDQQTLVKEIFRPSVRPSVDIEKNAGKTQVSSDLDTPNIFSNILCKLEQKGSGANGTVANWLVRGLT